MRFALKFSRLRFNLSVLSFSLPYFLFHFICHLRSHPPALFHSALSSVSFLATFAWPRGPSTLSNCLAVERSRAIPRSNTNKLRVLLHQENTRRAKEESQQTRKIRKQDISTNRVIQEAEKFVTTSSNSKSKHVVLGTGPKSLQTSWSVFRWAQKKKKKFVSSDWS